MEHNNIEIKNGYYCWKKGQNGWLNDWFKTIEFECKCKNASCIEQKISLELIKRLTNIREEVKSPLRIHSGFRCSAHQEAIRKSGVSTVVAKKSTHELGNAADISVSRLVTAELVTVAAKYFYSIGTALNFAHVDLRDDKIRRWDY